MLRRFSINFAVFSICLDLLMIDCALAFATYIRPSLSELSFVAYIPFPMYLPWVLYPLFSLLWIIILHLFSVYDGRKNLRVGNEIISLTLGSIIALISLAGILYLSYRDLSRFLFLSFIGIAYLLMLAWRIMFRLAFRLGIIKSVQTRRILVVGAGTVGRELETQIHAWANLGLKIVGFIDDDVEKSVQRSDILGTMADVSAIVVAQKVDDVVIALPPRAYEEVKALVAELHNLPVKVWIIPDYYHLALYKSEVEELAGIPMLDLRAPALSEYQRIQKRVVDLGITFLILPFALVFMAGTALAIWVEDHGPCFFWQQRVGENGKLFNMLKFRTMRPGAEKLRHLVERYDDQGNLIHKSPDDPRVTRVGRFLRRTSMDELPQIYNVLKGEMSWVGPRPELPYLVEKYQSWQRKRFSVPQGITGWWQVNGRSDRPMHLHTEDDLYYIQNYSIMLDLQILLKTVNSVIRRKGAF